MVAYSFQNQFASFVANGLKRQTTRPMRKNRHAKIGDKLQLFTGLRTKECRKLLTKEPICTAVDAIEIHLSRTVRMPKLNGLLLMGVSFLMTKLKLLQRPTAFLVVRHRRPVKKWLHFFITFMAAAFFAAALFIGRAEAAE
ncbi:hypothetical protein RAM19_06645 [Bartonella apihabitans]|nr:hypothetical protein [Bartonella apihabitans]WLT07808.1 hypothetical protein RAM19_06645 [Bartonella apihabitans]